jgi:hypothetical protein
MLDFGDSLREAWNNFVVGYNAMRQSELLQHLGWHGAGAAQVGQAFVVAAGVALGLTLLVLMWPPKGERDPLLRAWRGFLRQWAKRGAVKLPDESATAFLRQLRASETRASDAADLVQRFIALRYAPPGEGVDAERTALAEALRRYRPR